MKWVFLLLGLASLALSMKPSAKSQTLVIIGNFQGQLTPCGCTKPMSGGILRMASLLDQIGSKNRSLIVTGDLRGEIGRQSELKLDALGDFLIENKVSAVGLGAKDLELGNEIWQSFKARVPNVVSPGQYVDSGDYRIFSFGPTPSNQMVSLVSGSKKAPIVLFDGSESEAEAFAKLVKVPSGLIIFKSSARPSQQAKKLNGWLLCSPGEKGKSVLTIRLNKDQFDQYRTYELTPSYADSPSTKKMYNRYLGRVRDEKLLTQIQRSDAAGYVGDEGCSTCHTKEASIHEKTAHARAIQSIQKTGHEIDPDCVGCHVVGLEALDGFQSVTTTPKLARVGCESCHGAGRDHTSNPKIKTRLSAKAACASCHNSEHSPGFEFATMWAKIRHGTAEK